MPNPLTATQARGLACAVDAEVVEEAGGAVGDGDSLARCLGGTLLAEPPACSFHRRPMRDPTGTDPNISV